MREIRPSGLGGGVALCAPPLPHRVAGWTWVVRDLTIAATSGGGGLDGPRFDNRGYEGSGIVWAWLAALDLFNGEP